jgi:hypothetical protein
MMDEEQEPAQEQAFVPRRRAVVAERNERFFIEKQDMDLATGDQFWIVSPLNKSDPEQEICIRIPRDANDRQKILNVLNDEGEIAQLHLVQRKGNQFYDILAAEPALPDAKRAVHDDKGHAFTWTHELDEKVDGLFYHAMQHRIFALHAKLIEDDNLYNPILTHAKSIFASEMQSLGDKRGTEELVQLFEGGISPSLEGSKTSYADAMMGHQLTEKGELIRVYYDVLAPIDQQAKLPENPASRAAAIANFSMQRAAFDYLHSGLCQTTPDKDGVPVSFLEHVEKNLVQHRFLFGFHPTRTSADYCHLTTEISQRMTRNTVQGMVRSLGGHPANEAYDYVTPDERTAKRDEHGRPYTLNSFLYDSAYRAGHITHYADHEKNNGEPRDYLKKLNDAYKESEERFVAAKEKALAAEMDRAMAHGRTRVSDPSESANKRLQELALIEKTLLSIFEEVENPPSIF